MTDFQNCIEITEALGYDPKRYSPYQTAARYVRDAGFAFTDTTGGVWSPFRPSLAKRCGVRLHELVLIVSYHHHYVEKRRWAEWESRRDAAQQLVDFYAQKDPATRESWLFDPAYAFDNVGPEPVYDQAILDAAEVRSSNKARQRGQCCGCRRDRRGHRLIHRADQEVRQGQGLPEPTRVPEALGPSHQQGRAVATLGCPVMIEALLGGLGTTLVLLLGLLLKRLHDLDAKLDKHIDDSADFRADVRMLKDRWERER